MDQRVSFPGRTLFLTEDAPTIARQLAGEDLPAVPDGLADNISTDEKTPGWVCFWYDSSLGRYLLVGLRNQAIGRGAIKEGGFSVIVSGRSKGCGSSRETAPYSEKAAGIRLVIAKSIEKIYGQNFQNIGLLTSTDFGLIERIKNGEAIPISEFTRGLDPLSCAIVEHGGLFTYNTARLAGVARPPLPTTAPRPMTAVEKIIARHAITDAAKGATGVVAVKPGDAIFCRTDVRFTHDYVTPMAAAQFTEGFGKDAAIADAGRVYAFRDHLTFLKDVMPEAQRKQGLLQLADDLAVTQEAFCKRQGVKLYGEVAPERGGGSEAICHNAVLEDIAQPGELVIGTDSHTCTAGALGCFAFGVGSTDMANAWLTRDVRVTVPETVRIQIDGELSSSVSAKDVMLYVMADKYFKDGKAIGQVLEFTGAAVARMSVEERATLTNMAVEAGATTGFIAADEVTYTYMAKHRGAAPAREHAVRSDPSAHYAHTMHIDVSALAPMVATPGDPRNGVPVAALGEPVRIDIAYGGSCTGGKSSDMEMYARVLEQAVARGMRVKEGVRFYIQFGSQAIRARAEKSGWVELFTRAGAELVNPSCGACINAGPGVSRNEGQVTVSAINRNFPRRSGPGKVYLTSPLVVAASALAGYITTPEELFAERR
jgi:3-isopropylmalate/(R)-2-methylmalate dehydratase large subunit